MIGEEKRRMFSIGSLPIVRCLSHTVGPVCNKMWKDDGAIDWVSTLHPFVTLDCFMYASSFISTRNEMSRSLPDRLYKIPHITIHLTMM